MVAVDVDTIDAIVGIFVACLPSWRDDADPETQLAQRLGLSPDTRVGGYGKIFYHHQDAFSFLHGLPLCLLFMNDARIERDNLLGYHCVIKMTDILPSGRTFTML